MYFIFKLYKIVLVLPNIKMNLPQVYMCSPSWTLLPPPSPYHPFGSSQCTSPKHPVLCIEPGLATRFIHDILHVSMSFSQIFPPSFLCVLDWHILFTPRWLPLHNKDVLFTSHYNFMKNSIRKHGPKVMQWLLLT